MGFKLDEIIKLLNKQYEILKQISGIQKDFFLLFSGKKEQIYGYYTNYKCTI